MLTEHHILARIRASNVGRRTADVGKLLDTPRLISHSLPKCLRCAVETFWRNLSVVEVLS